MRSLNLSMVTRAHAMKVRAEEDAVKGVVVGVLGILGGAKKTGRIYRWQA